MQRRQATLRLNRRHTSRVVSDSARNEKPSATELEPEPAITAVGSHCFCRSATHVALINVFPFKMTSGASQKLTLSLWKKAVYVHHRKWQLFNSPHIQVQLRKILFWAIKMIDYTWLLFISPQNNKYKKENFNLIIIIVFHMIKEFHLLKFEPLWDSCTFPVAINFHHPVYWTTYLYPLGEHTNNVYQTKRAC